MEVEMKRTYENFIESLKIAHRNFSRLGGRDDESLGVTLLWSDCFEYEVERKSEWGATEKENLVRNIINNVIIIQITFEKEEMSEECEPWVIKTIREYKEYEEVIEQELTKEESLDLAERVKKIECYMEEMRKTSKYTSRQKYIREYMELNPIEKLNITSEKSLLEQIIEAKVTVDELEEWCIRRGYDMKSIGVRSFNDLIRLGITTQEDLSKLLIDDPEEFAAIGIGSLEDYLEVVAKQEVN